MSTYPDPTSSLNSRLNRLLGILFWISNKRLKPNIPLLVLSLFDIDPFLYLFHDLPCIKGVTLMALFPSPPCHPASAGFNLWEALAGDRMWWGDDRVLIPLPHCFRVLLSKWLQFFLDPVAMVFASIR